jgi:selenocysteine-specific elongation factor
MVGQSPGGIPVSSITPIINRRPAAILKMAKNGVGDLKSYEWKGEVYLFRGPERASLLTKIKETVAAFHASEPTRIGIEETQLAHTALPPLPSTIAAYWIRQAQSKGLIENINGQFRLPGRDAVFGGADEKSGRAFVAVFQEAGFAPPKLDRVVATLNLPKKSGSQLLKSLVASGELVSVGPDYTLHQQTVALAKHTLDAELEVAGSITTGRYRDLLTDAGRRAAIELLEYFDRTGVTKRIDNQGTRVRK